MFSELESGLWEMVKAVHLEPLRGRVVWDFRARTPRSWVSEGQVGSWRRQAGAEPVPGQQARPPGLPRLLGPSPHWQDQRTPLEVEGIPAGRWNSWETLSLFLLCLPVLHRG